MNLIKTKPETINLSTDCRKFETHSSPPISSQVSRAPCVSGQHVLNHIFLIYAKHSLSTTLCTCSHQTQIFDQLHNNECLFKIALLSNVCICYMIFESCMKRYIMSALGGNFFNCHGGVAKLAQLLVLFILLIIY